MWVGCRETGGVCGCFLRNRLGNDIKCIMFGHFVSGKTLRAIKPLKAIG